jgi:hypothetical protein
VQRAEHRVKCLLPIEIYDTTGDPVVPVPETVAPISVRRHLVSTRQGIETRVHLKLSLPDNGRDQRSVHRPSQTCAVARHCIARDCATSRSARKRSRIVPVYRTQLRGFLLIIIPDFRFRNLVQCSNRSLYTRKKATVPGFTDSNDGCMGGPPATIDDLYGGRELRSRRTDHQSCCAKRSRPCLNPCNPCNPWHLFFETFERIWFVPIKCQEIYDALR